MKTVGEVGGQDDNGDVVTSQYNVDVASHSTRRGAGAASIVEENASKKQKQKGDESMFEGKKESAKRKPMPWLFRLLIRSCF